MALTGMVPNLIWAPEFLGPHKIWALRNLGPKKASFEKAMTTFMRGPYFLGTKFLGAQISQGTNFVGPKKSGSQMRLGTISVIAIKLNLVKNVK